MQVLNNPDLRGQLGFLYKILDVPTHALSDLVAGLDDHVQLVGYRELMDLARQKRVLHEDVLPAEGAVFVLLVAGWQRCPRAEAGRADASRPLI